MILVHQTLSGSLAGRSFTRLCMFLMFVPQMISCLTEGSLVDAGLLASRVVGSPQDLHRYFGAAKPCACSAAAPLAPLLRLPELICSCVDGTGTLVLFPMATLIPLVSAWFWLGAPRKLVMALGNHA